MMSREWVKDTREAWARAANEALRRAGCGERIDHRSLAERRDEAERAGDLEREGRGEKKRGFGCGPSGLEQDNQALRQERDGLIERIKERIAGIYRELQALPGSSGTLYGQ